MQYILLVGILACPSIPTQNLAERRPWALIKINFTSKTTWKGSLWWDFSISTSFLWASQWARINNHSRHQVILLKLSCLESRPWLCFMV